MLADTPERMEWLKMAHARARYLGLETELLTVSEAKKLMPLHRGALFRRRHARCRRRQSRSLGHHPCLCQIGAHQRRGDLSQQTGSRELKPRRDGGWDVITEQGTTAAEHVVNCGGLWAREVGRMVGIELPVLAMEHMYLVTDEMPEVMAFNKEHGHELPHAIDFKAEIYMRQEGKRHAARDLREGLRAVAAAR